MRTGIWRRRFEKGLLAALAMSLVLLVTRIIFFGRLTYAFLAWNLVLAVVPYGFARLLEWYHDRCPTKVPVLSVIFLGWLFFFPNAPYIFTDYIHLERLTSPHEWLFNIVLVSVFAITGLFFGLWSFFLVHEVIRERFGWMWGWIMVAREWVRRVPRSLSSMEQLGRDRASDASHWGRLLPVDASVRLSQPSPDDSAIHVFRVRCLRSLPVADLGLHAV